MAKLELTQGYTAQVSKIDLPDLLTWKWSAVRCGDKRGKIPQIYAARGIRRGDTFKRMYLHKFIASKMYSMDEMKKKTLTFADGDKLNCTRENLILHHKRIKRSKA